MTSPPVAPGTAPRDSRLRSLDGLRGVAALVVVFHHSLFLIPVMAVVQERLSAGGEPWPVWAVTHTPVHLVWAGEEAVLVFFVLSGLVLTLPAIASRGIGWRSYYPRRLVRLYVPVWGAVVLATILAAMVPRVASPQRSLWLNDRADVDLNDAWSDAILMRGASLLNTPLWSLQWEVLFSLALPAFLLLGLGRRGAPILFTLGLLAAIGLGTYLGISALRFMPVFGLGVLMAFHSDRIAAAARWIDTRPRPGRAWAVVVTVSVLLLTGRWLLAGLPMRSQLLEALASGGTIIGAVLAVFLAMHWRPGADVLEMGAIQWLGTRSFSLYLIHEPVIVTVGFLLPARTPPWVISSLAIPAALLVTAAFFRLVEAPAHRASRAVGHLANRWEARAVSPDPNAAAEAGPLAVLYRDSRLEARAHLPLGTVSHDAPDPAS